MAVENTHKAGSWLSSCSCGLLMGCKARLGFRTLGSKPQARARSVLTRPVWCCGVLGILSWALGCLQFPGLAPLVLEVTLGYLHKNRSPERTWKRTLKLVYRYVLKNYLQEQCSAELAWGHLPSYETRMSLLGLPSLVR